MMIHDSTHDDLENQEPPRRSRGLGLRILLLVLLVTLVLGVVFLAAYRDGTGFDVVRRYLNYGKAETVGKEAMYQYETSNSNRFAILHDTLVVLSSASLQVLSRENGEVYTESINMTSPALDSGGGYAVAYDIGGTELRVVNGTGLVFSLSMNIDEPILNASLNDSGYLVVTTNQSYYYKCSVTVYENTRFEKRFSFNSHNRYVSCARLMNDNVTLAASALGQEDGVFISNVLIYDISKEDPQANFQVADGIVLDMGSQSGDIVTISDNSLTFTNRRGEQKGEYTYHNTFLRDYCLDGDGFAALLLNRYKAGSVGRLVTVNTGGTEIGSLDISEDVQSLSACGRYLAVLYLDRVEVYNERMELYATLSGLDGAQAVLVQQDGSVLILSASSAKMFLP